MTLDDIKAEIPDDYWERVNQRIIDKINDILAAAHNAQSGTIEHLDSVRAQLKQIDQLIPIWNEHMKSKPND